MSHYQDFSSWRPEHERHFVVFEQHSVEAGKKAWTAGAMVAAGAFVVILAVVLAFKPDKSASEAAVQVDEQPGASLPAESGAATTPAATPPAAAPTEGAAAPTEGAATAPAAGGATAPTPPAGATKAPPTALVGQ
ncbi:MAG TPA: hypothetical protein VKZ63_07570 [Kofleriaceae bacterium]|nr:hypothetical protein [Kofleriaceae bacterium]